MSPTKLKIYISSQATVSSVKSLQAISNLTIFLQQSFMPSFPLSFGFKSESRLGLSNGTISD